jgi:hypothetical protein
VVRLLYGSGITDVNVPFRLIRSNVLRQLIDRIPEGTFAPNIVISGMLARTGARVYEHPVPHENRKTGKTSLARLRLWQCAVKAFGQTLYRRSTVGVVLDDGTDSTTETPEGTSPRGQR